MRKNRKRRKNVYKRKRLLIINALLVLFLFLGIGYSALSTDLNIFGNIQVKKYENKSLYGVLENAAKEGTYAKEYTGEHHDSFTEEPSKKIYHWYAANEIVRNQVLDKINVIFADHCWQMIRTTDTGGVKLLYNGEAEEGKCLNSRSKHIGYNSGTITSLSTEYYYGTSYTYDKTNNVFSLDGTVTTGNIHTGQYTCKETTSSGTCTTLYLVDMLASGTEYYVLRLEGNSNYSSFGSLRYNRNSSTPASVGYMYNKTYPTMGLYSSTYTYLYNRPIYYMNIEDFSYEYYADDISYNSNTHNYSLINPKSITTISDYNDLVGTYLLTNGNSSNCESAIYIMKIEDNRIKYTNLSYGSYPPTMVIGDSYTDNGNGTYTINNPTLLKYENIADGEYYYDYNKYACDGESATCNNLKYIILKNESEYYYWETDKKYKYSENMNYSNGTYTLTGDIKTIWNWSLENVQTISPYRYSCLSNEITCSKVNYIYYYSINHIFYITIDNEQSVSSTINTMFHNNYVNNYNSEIKTGVDAWYKKYMLPYNNQIEDIIFCNNRSFYDEESSGWNINGGDLEIGMRFKNHPDNSNNQSLECANITDKFSTSNIYAKLNYPIGLIDASEVKLLGIPSILQNDYYYWTMAPLQFIFSQAYVGYVSNSGYVINNMNLVTAGEGLRPTISLNPETKYRAGNGSMEEPYYVGEVNHITSNSYLVPKESPPDYTVKLGNEDYAVTSFKLDGATINGDSFVMPHHDVTITDVQYIQAYYTITNNDPDINVPERGRYRSTIELTSNNYVVNSFKVNGTLTTGNSFTMPSENVTITDIQKTPRAIVESEHYPYANNINNVTYYENTFTDATSINVELTYQTENKSCDWIYLYDNPNSTTPFNNKKYGGYYLTTETLTIPSNYIKIVFKTDGSSNNYYGFKAVITPNYD